MRTASVSTAMSSKFDPLAILSSTLFVAAIVLANWLTTRYGFVPVGLGLSATAGTFAAGATFTLRDDIDDRAGRWWVLALIAVGGAVSYIVADPFIAKASVCAFVLAELADLSVYAPLRRRNWTAAVWLSGLVGSLADSLMFLWLAFGWAAVSSSAVAGQVLGKMWAVGAVWLIVRWIRNR